MNKSISVKLWVIILSIAIALIVIFVAAISAYQTAIGQNISDEILQQKLDQDQEYTARKAELDKLNEDIDSQQGLLNELNMYKSNAENLSQALNDKQQQVYDLDLQIQERQGKVDSLNAEIDSLSNTVKVKQEEPTVIPAGEYTVSANGSVRPGRYSVTGSSNFVVHSSTGDLKVNTILGGGSFGVDQYVCNLSSGDNIKAQSRCTLTPVE